MTVIFANDYIFRINELSPCKENSNMSHKSILSERAKRQSNDSSTATNSGSSLTTSALDRLRYNLSPVTSYYKPIMKSFTRRDDSPSKVSTNTTKKNQNFHPKISKYQNEFYINLRSSIFRVSKLKTLLFCPFHILNIFGDFHYLEKRRSRQRQNSKS